MMLVPIDFLDRKPMLPCVLIVEDYLDNALLLVDMLAHLDCRTVVAADGLEALEQVSRYQPDLILLDIVLPRCNGIEFARCLKQQQPTIPIVAVTGLTFPEEKLAIAQAGCDGYLAKPILLEELERTVKHYLGPKLIACPFVVVNSA
ncbi:MAG: response regulator [Chloroflexaceae bacterium]|nr:response regulator [Chloroflexaceae bacterium]